METPLSTLVVVSPHLDDAALSVGGLVAEWTQRGGRAVLATAFTADEPAAPPSAVAEQLQRLWGGPGAMARRRAEDAAAASVLGAEVRHLGLDDALHRCGPKGDALYTSLGALFGTPSPVDQALAHELADRLVAGIADLDPDRILLAPLGLGRHVDHLHTRHGATLAAQRLERDGQQCDLGYYEDFPYNEKRFSGWTLRRGLRPLLAPVSEASLEARCAAIAAYPSQVAPLFDTEVAMRGRVTRITRRLGGERLWVPGSGPATSLHRRLQAVLK